MTNCPSARGYARQVQAIFPMETPLLSTDWLSSWLEGQAQTLTDEFGSFYVWLEGRAGGETVLLWLTQDKIEAVLRQLPKQFKGRIVLAVDASGGHATALQRALHWANPRKVLLIGEGRGVGTGFSGYKQLESGETVALSDPRPAGRLEVELESGFRYLEVCEYPAWQGQQFDLPKMEGSRLGAVGWNAGIPTYSVGLDAFDQTLPKLFDEWRLL